MCPLSTTSRPRRLNPSTRTTTHSNSTVSNAPPSPIPPPTYTRSRTPPGRPSARHPRAHAQRTEESGQPNNANENNAPPGPSSSRSYGPPQARDSRPRDASGSGHTAARRPGGIRIFTPHDDAVSEASVAAFAHRVRPTASASARGQQGGRRAEGAGRMEGSGERSVGASEEGGRKEYGTNTRVVSIWVWDERWGDEDGGEGR